MHSSQFLFPSFAHEKTWSESRLKGKLGSDSQAPLLGDQDLLSVWGIWGFCLPMDVCGCCCFKSPHAIRLQKEK